MIGNMFNQFEQHEVRLLMFVISENICIYCSQAMYRVEQTVSATDRTAQPDGFASGAAVNKIARYRPGVAF